jgi:uncharacterized membrane protein
MPTPAPHRSRPLLRPSPRLRPWLLALVALDGLAIIAIWAVNLAQGAFDEGILTYQLQGTVPLYHLIAELTMALVLLTAVLGWATGRGWARAVLPFGLGMGTYAAINALGWAFHNDPVTAVPVLVTIVLAVLVVTAMSRSRRERRSDGPTPARHRR